MIVNPFSLIGDKIDKKDIFAEFKGIMGDDIPSLDFNDYTTNGWYESTGTNRTGSANVPHAEDNGYLLVVSKSRTVYQYWYSTYRSLGTMVRARKNGTWGSWDTVALDKGSVSVTADGVKNYSQLFNELKSLVNFSKVSVNTKLSINTSYFIATYNGGSNVLFSQTDISSQLPSITRINVASNSSLTSYQNNSWSDVSTSVPGNGTKITIYY